MIYINKKTVIFVCACLLFCSSFLSAEIVRRAAFDFGSGKIKLQVADVDTINGLIVESIYSESIVVLLSEDMAKHPEGCFSEEIQNKAIIAARYLKEKATLLNCSDFMGLATEAYRKAPNAKELVDRYFSELNIRVRIISQEEEGKNGFFALVAEMNLDPLQVVSWDIGGGSFQVTYLDDEKNMQVYMAPFGRMTTKKAMIQFVKKEDPSKITSPNPISAEEWENAIQYFDQTLPAAQKSLVMKLKKPGVQLIGISAHPQQLRELKIYHLNDVVDLLQERLNKNDVELAKIHGSPPSAVSELALIYSIMQKLDTTTVNYIRTSSGSTSALLIMEEYW